MSSIQGVLYLRNEKEELRWFEDVDPITEDGKYVGQIKNGEPCGHGTFTYPNGEKYVGEWKDGKRHGQGTYTLPNGEKYVGEFKDGLANGQGTETFSNGEKYIGEFKDGKFHGQGTKTWSDGMYVGKYKDGKLWTGIFYNKNRNISFKVVNGRMIKQ